MRLWLISYQAVDHIYTRFADDWPSTYQMDPPKDIVQVTEVPPVVLFADWKKDFLDAQTIGAPVPERGQSATYRRAREVTRVYSVIEAGEGLSADDLDLVASLL